MKRIFTLLTLTFFLGAYSAQAQRYLEEVFDDVTVTQDQEYGVNASVLAYAFFGEAVPETLTMDVYEPEGDTETARPLILYFHTGNFLPTPENGSPSGTNRDLTTVEICSRFAKMGYVVASCNYRLGWNPLAETQDERVNTLINAAYRGVQDARTATRWFRMNAEGDNDYGIDTDRIAMFGQGTGGYITYATATLDEYEEVLLPKFIAEVDGMPIPMVIEQVNGDIFGTSVGINPMDGDTLCYPNHVGFSSDFNAAVNFGGAMGDISWLEEGDMPMISFQAPTDPFAPYETGVLIVPGANLPVVEVMGAGVVQAQVADYGNNDVFANTTFTDPYSVAAAAINGGNDGLYPILRPAGAEADSSPWDYWSEDNPNNAAGLLTNPDMSEMKAHTYIDTIQFYTAPRLACALELDGAPCETGGGVANDDCSGSVDINAQFGGGMDVGQSSGPYSNVGATANGDPDAGWECFDDNNTSGTNGSASLENTVWFSFTGDGQSYAIETTDCDGTAVFFQGDTQMAIYSGTCDDLTPVACNEDLSFAGQNYYSYNFIETQDGVEYYILVDGYDYTDFQNGEPATGDFCINVTQTTTSVEENELIGLTLFPNPAAAELNLTADTQMDFVTIYNVVGEQVLNQQVNANREVINIDALSAGVYVVEVTAGNVVSTLRFIKE